MLFNKKNYNGALECFRNVLRINPNCPSSVRVAIGYCFQRLNKLDKVCVCMYVCVNVAFLLKKQRKRVGSPSPPGV